MKSISRRALTLYLLIFLFLAGSFLSYYRLAVNADKWAMNKVNEHLYTDGAFTAGNITDRNGTVLATTENGVRTYNKDAVIRAATLQTVGDGAGYIASGIQTSFKDELTGYTIKDGVFNLKRYGKGNDISLTLDADICKAAYNAMGSYNGVVGVMNYKTGEIICIVSTPSYDPLNKPSEEKEGMYLNKFFGGVYTPGSTFKILTLASAIENIPNLENMTFECKGHGGKGQIQIGEGYVYCSGVHGKIGIEKAFNQSCNCAFAELADTLGKEKLTATAEKAGFNTQMNKINGKISCSTSTLKLGDAKALDLGWAGIGQYTTLVSPCHMLTLVSSIANGGTAVEPYVVNSIITPGGKKLYTAETREIGEYFSTATAERLQKYMRSNVENYYGDYRFADLQMCGKTGTAEISDSEDAKPNALFAGFSSNPDYPFAIIVVVENSTFSIQTAVPVATKVMTAVKNVYSK